MLKVAQYAAQLENYERAITIYEQVAASALESSLIKYSAKDYFFRAALCHLCVDVVNAQHACSRYEEQFPAFCDSREVKLVKVRFFCTHLLETLLSSRWHCTYEFTNVENCSSKLNKEIVWIGLRPSFTSNVWPCLVWCQVNIDAFRLVFFFDIF